MLQNYLKIALRNLLKHKGFSFIQIIGLSIGICIALAIAMLVHHEFSYDRHHKDGDRIYRVVSSSKFDDAEFLNSGVPAPLAEAVKNDISGIEDIVAFHIWEDVKVSISEEEKKPRIFKHVYNIIFTNTEYLDLLSYEWLAGSPHNALSEPYQVVLTHRKAKEYFVFNNPGEAIGEVILYQDSIQATVTGIVKDPEHLTDFVFDQFISIATIDKTYLKDEFYINHWDNISSSSQLLIKLEHGVRENTINAQFPALLKKYLSGNNYNQSHRLQPLSDIHFNENYGSFSRRTAHKPTLYGLSLLSGFILVLACINFINLTTAQSGIREKEISVRKTFGSSKKQLAFQFLGESIVKTFLATGISILFLPYLFSYFSSFLPQELDYQNFVTLPNLLILIPFIIVVGIMAGGYPAFILASLRPFWLKGNTSVLESRRYLGKTLIVFQFAIAFCLIIGSYIVSKQIKYGLTKDLGYEKDAIINIQMPWKSSSAKKEQLYHKLQGIPEFGLVSLGGQPPASHGTMSRGIEFSPKKEPDPINAEFKYGDPDYVKLYGLKVLAGRHLSLSDTVREVIINETFVKRLGYENPEGLIGNTLKFNEKEVPIVGVVADFHSKSTREYVMPLIITSEKQYYGVLHAKLLPQSATWEAALKKAEDAWSEIFPDEPFSYQFFDDKIASFYESEKKLNQLLNWATGIAIFISCLGLVGIIAFTIQQKTKEIGIRKVLGASVSGILILLSKDFVKLIIIAFIIATPFGYYLVNSWLDNFAYKIDLSWWLFVVPGIALLGIALLVLSFQSIKAALANPVDSLRNE